MWPRNFIHITMALKWKCIFKKWAWNRTYIHYCWYFGYGRDRLWWLIRCDAMLWLCFTTSTCTRIICENRFCARHFHLKWNRDNAKILMMKSTYFSTYINEHRSEKCETHKSDNWWAAYTHTYAVAPKICRTLKTDAKLDRQRDMKKRERAWAKDSPNQAS